MAEQLQFYIRELLHQEGKIALYKDTLEDSLKQNEDLTQKVKELKIQLKEEQEKVEQYKTEVKDVKMSVHRLNDRHLRESLKDKLKQRHKEKQSLKKSKSRLLIKKKHEIELSHDKSQDKDERVSSDSSNGRGRVKPFQHQKHKSDSNDTSNILSSMKKKASRFNSNSPIYDEKSRGSSEESTRKRGVTKDGQYQILPTNHNNYDLKPYCTELTTNEHERVEVGESVPEPIPETDNSPLVTRDNKMKTWSKNKTFLDFQKSLNNKFNIKPEQENYYTGKNTKLHLIDNNHSIDMNPIVTVDSSVKSMIFKENQQNESSVPSSFVDTELVRINSRKPSVQDNICKNRVSMQKNKLKISRQGLNMHDITASGDFGNSMKPPTT